MTTAGYLLRLIRLRLVLFVLAGALLIVATVSPLLFGLVLREFFDNLTGDAAAARNIWLLILVLFALSLAVTVFQRGYEFVSPLFADLSKALIRTNVFRGVLDNPAVRIGPSPGDAINRITQDVGWIVVPIGRDKAPEVIAFVVSIPLTLAVMISINPAMTALALLPVFIVPIFHRAYLDQDIGGAYQALSNGQS
jgi:ATP-binding cassette subfamily B protein